MAGLGGAQPVGVGAGGDDVGVEGEPVDDGGAEPRVGEGGCPFGEGGVGRDRDGGAFLAFGEDLEQQLGAAPVQLEVAQLVQAEQVDAAVAGDGAGQGLVVGGLDELVDQRGGGDVPDPVAVLGGGGAQPDQQVGLAGAASRRSGSTAARRPPRRPWPGWRSARRARSGWRRSRSPPAAWAGGRRPRGPAGPCAAAPGHRIRSTAARPGSPCSWPAGGTRRRRPRRAGPGWWAAAGSGRPGRSRRRRRCRSARRGRPGPSRASFPAGEQLVVGGHRRRRAGVRRQRGPPGAAR